MSKWNKKTPALSLSNDYLIICIEKSSHIHFPLTSIPPIPWAQLEIFSIYLTPKNPNIIASLNSIIEEEGTTIKKLELTFYFNS